MLLCNQGANICIILSLDTYKLKMKNIKLIAIVLVLACSSCGQFNINEAASNSHKCPSKHARRLHSYGGKLYYSYEPQQNYIQQPAMWCF